MGRAARLTTLRADRADCEAARPGTVPGLGTLEVVECKLKDAEVGYRAYLLRKGKTLYAAEGLVGL